MPSRTPYGKQTGVHVEWVAVRRRTLFVVAAALTGLALAGAGAYWLIKNPLQTRIASVVDQTTSGASAHFTELNGTVKVRKAGTYEWIDAKRSVALRKNDTVRTVGKSSARVRLFDGTEYLVKPDTIFIIEIMYEDPHTKAKQVAVKLTTGQVNLQTPRKSVAGSRSELATPTTEASFDGMTVAEVGYDESSQVSDFAVYRGGSQLRAGGQEVELASNQMIKVHGEDEFSEIIDLPGIPVLDLPTHLSRLFYPNPARETTQLKWKPVPEARRYHVMLDLTPNFSDPQEYRVRGLEVLVPGLMPGTYYWWVSAVDAENREGGFSDFAKFTVTRQASADKPPTLRVSRPSVSIDGLITVKGVTDPDAVVTVNDVRVPVKADGSFQHIYLIDRAGRHPIVVRANKRSGGTAEETVFATVGSD